MAKAKSSSSPLARPSTLIHRLAAEIQQHLFLPDPSPMYVSLATVAGNMLSGVPLWVMLIGPGGCGKTEMINLNGKVKGVHIVGGIEGRSALLSGTSNKERARSATGGLMLEIGQRGVMAPKDFTSTLSLDHGKLNETISALREITDCEWKRPIGADGGKSLIWRGSVGFLGACTNKLDRYHKVIQELGQRWIYYRFPETDGYGETMVGNRAESLHEVQVKCQEMVADFFDSVALDWHCWEPCQEDHQEHISNPKRELNVEEMNRLFAMGAIVARSRSIVPREGWGAREIDGQADIEPPTRLNKALIQLYLGLEAIGLGASERWKIVSKMAMDSMPQMRATLISQLYGMKVLGEEPKLKVQEIQDVLRVSLSTTKRMCEDLEILGVVQRVDSQSEKWARITEVQLSGWAVQEMDKGLKNVR